MKLSINSAVDIDYTEVGFGHAISNIYKALIQLGHEVHLDNPDCPVQLNWMQPHLLKVNRKSYNILYFPWESTEISNEWKAVCNSEYVDEVWTTTPWCREILIEQGVEQPVEVFEHGISSDWEPKLRKKDGPLKYLVVDCEANRKGYQEAFDAFVDVFGWSDKEATLTLKTRQRCMVRWHDERRRVHAPEELPNVSVKVGRTSNKEMVQMYQDHDVLIYPSYGEGFGFIPFQMLATGAPAIVTKEWASYKSYLGELGLNSHYGPTKWPGEHNGEVCYPDAQHLRELIRFAHDDFDNQAKVFFKQSFNLHNEYDWLKLTEKAFEKLVKKFP